ncbi:MAG: NUDIX hydrolase [Planctomycetota bacterium]
MNAGQLILKSRKYTVRRIPVTVATGAVHDYDIVVHPGAAIILPFLPDGRVLLIRNFRVAVQQELLELPAGTLDPPEPPIECARRELTEETGYSAGSLEELIVFYSTPGICTERMHVFAAHDLKPGPTQLEAGERIHPAPMEYDDALRAIHDGRIVDGKTIVALLFYERFKLNKRNH